MYRTICSLHCLSQHSQGLAAVAIETSVALAHACAVVTSSTSTASAPLGTTVPLENIVARWAFFLHTVWSTVSRIAFAPSRTSGIPSTVVLGTSVLGSSALSAVVGAIRGSEQNRGDSGIRIVGKVIGKLAQSLAGSMPIAVVRANITLACRSTVTCIASALSRSTSALSTSRALNLGRDVIIVR